ncbi:MAG: hypothetical protein GXY05_12620 [Clostridiales bacterium]|nr:hypothetical protein [Clostridiales bacterium]
MYQHKVVLVGSPNYNGLGLVRSFGVNGIKPYGIVIGRDSQKNYMEKSRYWAKTWHVDDAEDVMPLLRREFSSEEYRPVVFTWVDKMVQLFDAEYDTLSERFILPSFDSKQGLINHLLSKKEQTDFAESIGFKMLLTMVLQLPENKDDKPSGYPVILKPVAGSEGEKRDIKICYDEQEYQKAIDIFVNKSYTRILRQPYLENRIEFVLLGAICPKEKYKSFTVLKNTRQWPVSFGIGCFSEYVTEPKVLDFADSLFTALIERGYDGPIDIELFQANDGTLYINEFNWRTSGRNFTALDTGVYSIVWWYMLKTGHSLPDGQLVNRRAGYTMKELEDFRHVMSKTLTLRQWLADRKKTTGFALWDKRDMRPARYQYRRMLKKLIFRE